MSSFHLRHLLARVRRVSSGREGSSFPIIMKTRSCTGYERYPLESWWSVDGKFWSGTRDGKMKPGKRLLRRAVRASSRHRRFKFYYATLPGRAPVGSGMLLMVTPPSSHHFRHPDFGPLSVPQDFEEDVELSGPSGFQASKPATSKLPQRGKESGSC